MTKRKSGDEGSKGAHPLVQGASHKTAKTTRADVVDDKRTHLSKCKEEEPKNPLPKKKPRKSTQNDDSSAVVVSPTSNLSSDAAAHLVKRTGKVNDGKLIQIDKKTIIAWARDGYLEDKAKNLDVTTYVRNQFAISEGSAVLPQLSRRLLLEDLLMLDKGTDISVMVSQNDPSYTSLFERVFEKASITRNSYKMRVLGKSLLPSVFSVPR
jgi:hypothetical protein